MSDESRELEPSTGVGFLPFPKPEPAVASFIAWLTQAVLLKYGLTPEEMGVEKR